MRELRLTSSISIPKTALGPAQTEFQKVPQETK